MSAQKCAEFVIIVSVLTWIPPASLKGCVAQKLRGEDMWPDVTWGQEVASVFLSDEKPCSGTRGICVKRILDERKTLTNDAMNRVPGLAIALAFALAFLSVIPVGNPASKCV
jgi:hypothetical protein